MDGRTRSLKENRGKQRAVEHTEGSSLVPRVGVLEDSVTHRMEAGSDL